MSPSGDPISSNSNSRFAITTRRPVAILMIVMAVCVFGWVSYQRLSLDLMPDITYPTLTVRTEYPGTAPEEVETLISRPLERELGVVPHLVSISSISKAGLSDVILEFEWDADMNTASQDIREKVDRTWLPEEAEKPLLLRYDPSLDPILRVGLFGELTLYALRELAEHEIRRDLEKIPGVAAVKVKGGLEEEIHVALNERQLSLLGLDIGQINQRLSQANVNLPGGQLREGQTEYLVRTLNEFQSLEEIGDLIVAQQGSADIRLRDIGQVVRSHRDREIVTRVNGRESVELEIYKEADANIVAVARSVKARLHGLPQQRAFVEQLRREEEKEAAAEVSPDGEEGGDDQAEDAEEAADEESEDEGADLKEQKRQAAIRTMEVLIMTDFIEYQLPEGAEMEVLSDQSIFIINSIEEVQKSALIGGAMAILVLFVFLRNVVHTLIIGVTIPISIVATFAPMYLFDVSLNIMSLGGLALGIGMLVDNSIVVLESIFRCREEGDDLVQATIRGTGEVGSAVLASTLTTIAVFFPIVFVEGIAGQVFGDMSLTVVFSLLASLAVALYLIPMLASRQVRTDAGAMAQLRSHSFLRLQAVERVRSATSGGSPGRQRLLSAVVSLPLLLYEVSWRLLLVALTLVAAALKAVAILLFEVVWIPAKPIEKWRVRPEQTFQDSFVRWAAGTRLGRWDPCSRLWPGILGYGSPEDLSGGFRALCRWVWGGRSTGWTRFLWRSLRLPTFPLVSGYFLVRFIFHTALRLVGIVLTSLLLALALLAVVSAYLVALVLAPVVLPLLLIFGGGLAAVQQVYPVVLRIALRQRLVVIGLAALSFWLCWSELVPQLGSELIPQVHQGEFNLDIALPVGTPLQRTAQVVQRMEERVLEARGVERVATTVGTDMTATASSDEGEHTAQITIKMPSGSDARAEEDLIARLRHRLSDIPEVTTEISYPALFSFKTPIEVEIRGHDIPTLRSLSLEVVARLSSLPGLADVKSTLQVGNPELQVVYNRDRVAEFGLDLRTVAELVRNKVQGRVATDFRREERNIDVLVRLREHDRLGVDELRRLVVNPSGDVPIALGSVADIGISEGPSEIRRIDQQRAALVTANIRGIDLGTASSQIELVLRDIDFPTGCTYLISGQNREMETSLRSMVLALALAIFLVYIVMASQFESLVHPFVIMFTVPLAVIGVVVVLYAGQIALSVVVFIGLIMLAGIVVNNAIVLVDYINTLRRKGMAKREAIVQAGSVRLRPILMTTLTTVLGLLPMALGLGEGAEIRTPMAITVIAGLTSSTFLTLIVVPTVYSLVDRRP
ncbi:efflux RND transporter permease subunit [Candidatus Latescibacterota bacterium]